MKSSHIIYNVQATLTSLRSWFIVHVGKGSPSFRLVSRTKRDNHLFSSSEFPLSNRFSGTQSSGFISFLHSLQALKFPIAQRVLAAVFGGTNPLEALAISHRWKLSSQTESSSDHSSYAWTKIYSLIQPDRLLPSTLSCHHLTKPSLLESFSKCALRGQSVPKLLDQYSLFQDHEGEAVTVLDPAMHPP